MNIKRRLKSSVPVLIACAAALIFAAAVPSCGRSSQRETEETFCVRAGGTARKTAREYGAGPKSTASDTGLEQTQAGTNRAQNPGRQYAAQYLELCEELKTAD
ncbi:MAG: hypothetical protein ACI4I0_00440 [Acutalibacteraceae bacterium]